MKYHNFLRRRDVLLTGFIIWASTISNAGHCKQIADNPEETFSFFQWLCSLAGLDIDNPDDRVPMIHWLADFDGELQAESSVFRCFSPGINDKEFVAQPSRFIAISAKEKTRNCTVAQPSWNQHHYGFFDSVLHFKHVETVKTIVVHVSARKEGDSWKLIELRRSCI